MPPAKGYRLRGFWNGLDKREKTVMGLAILGLLVSGVLLSNDRFLGGATESAPGVSIGRLRGAEHDIRIKSDGSFAWNRADDRALVRAGDSIYTGKNSRATIELNAGGDVNLGENSVALFAKHGDLQIPDLTTGNFRVHVQGSMKIAIAGEVVELRGSSSEVQVFVDQKGKASTRLLSGAVEIRGKKTFQVGRVATRLDGGAESPEPFVFHAMPRMIDVPVRFDEAYWGTGQDLHPRPELSENVESNLALRWSGPAQKVYVQLARDAEFRERTELEAGPLEREARPGSVHTGTNHWRVSTDRVRWETAPAFEVARSYLPETPVLAPLPARVPLRDAAAPLELRNGSPVGGLATLFELSPDADFQPNLTRVVRAADGAATVSLTRAGAWFVRARFMNTRGEISGYSNASMVTAFAPPPPSTPKPVPLRMARPARPRPLPAPKPEHEAEEQVVSAAPLVPAEPSSVSAFRIDTPPDQRNDRFGGSRLQLEGSIFTMFSRQQVDAGLSAPVGTLVNLRFLHWWGRLGAEMQLKTKLFSANDSARATAPTVLDLRLHAAASSGALFDIVRELKWSGFLGAEFFRNRSASLYSPGYDLVKAGFSLAFPVGVNWDAGGEAAYGFSPSKDRKYELSGFFSFFLEKKWSMGVGYRMNYFEAGSRASAPSSGLPYREAYGEGFSTLRWHY